MHNDYKNLQKHNNHTLELHLASLPKHKRDLFDQLEKDHANQDQLN